MPILRTGLLPIVISQVVNVCPAFLAAGSVVALDQHNWVRFEIAQFDSPGHATGPTPRLVGERGGASFEWIVADDLTTHHPRPIRPELEDLAYRDADHLWMLVRRGHRLSGAYLLDLGHQQVLATYTGASFTVSPDSQHIAFTYPGTPSDTVFFDGRLVFPEVRGSVVHAPPVHDDPPGPRLDDGGSLFELSPAESGARLAGPIRWQSADQLTFLISGGRTPGFYRLFRVRAALPPGAAVRSRGSVGAQDESLPMVECLPIPVEQGDQAVREIGNAAREGRAIGWFDALPAAASAEFLMIGAESRPQRSSAPASRDVVE